MKTLLAGIVVVTCLSVPAVAEVVYEQPLDPFDRWGGGPDSTTGGQEFADQFVLAKAASVNRVTWYGSYNFSDPWVNGDSVAFQIRFFADGGNVPAHPPFASAAVNAVVNDTGMDGANLTRVYLFDASVAVDLSAGTTYWVSITESDTRTEFDRMTWDTPPLGTGILGSAMRYAHPEITTPWEVVNDSEDNYRSSMAFALYGSQVPEPSAAVGLGGLLAMGLVLAWRRRRLAA